MSTEEVEIKEKKIQNNEDEDSDEDDHEGHDHEGHDHEGHKHGEDKDGKKANRGEKKFKKAMIKLGMKPVTGITRVTIRKGKSVIYHNLDNSYYCTSTTLRSSSHQEWRILTSSSVSPR